MRKSEVRSFIEEMERTTGATTLFCLEIGTNVVWGYRPPEGLPAEAGVAISQKNFGQVFVNIKNLRRILAELERTLVTKP